MVMEFKRSSSAPSKRGHAEEQATYGMANLAPEETGLSFVVFAPQRDGARHAARVKVSLSAKTIPNEMGSYGVPVFRHFAGPRLATSQERDLEAWIGKNRTVLEGYWEGTIAYTSQLLRRLEPL